ncbi:hypothetical protein ACFRCW_39980 [Streptomyces sp. NPDC056653]|uniref:hypothetical protein n=1 Tax=Streptomyces sp. NPDC056653 TaxID=3345894 RepID=UPI0036856652
MDELAADFELARQEEETVAADVEEEVRRIRERGQPRIQGARAAAMGEFKETAARCGQRPGVGADRIKDLRRLRRETDTAEDSTAGADEKGGGGRGRRAAA